MAEFVHTGRVIVSASPLKGTLSSMGLGLLSLLSAGMSYAVFQEEGGASIKGWGCAFIAVLVLWGIAVMLGPMIRQRQLTLTPDELIVSSRRKGTRTRELSLRWEEIQNIEIHRSTNGEGTTTDDVRVKLAPGVRADLAARSLQGFIDLPAGLEMPKKDLASLLEMIRVNQE